MNKIEKERREREIYLKREGKVRKSGDLVLSTYCTKNARTEVIMFDVLLFSSPPH